MQIYICAKKFLEVIKSWINTTNRQFSNYAKNIYLSNNNFSITNFHAIVELHNSIFISAPPAAQNLSLFTDSPHFHHRLHNKLIKFSSFTRVEQLPPGNKFSIIIIIASFVWQLKWKFNERIFILNIFESNNCNFWFSTAWSDSFLFLWKIVSMRKNIKINNFKILSENVLNLL